MKKGCIKCYNKNASGGSMELLIRKEIEPDFRTVHEFSKYQILICKQCGEYFLYNQKIFEDMKEDQIPALLNWEKSQEFFEKNRTQLQPIFKHNVFDSLYAGLFEIKLGKEKEEAIILAYDYPISGNYYDPLKALDATAQVSFIRANNEEEMRSKKINKYLVRHKLIL